MFFCLAVNMLPVYDLKIVLESSDRKTKLMTVKEKTAFVEKELRICAEQLGIPLVLRKW